MATLLDQWQQVNQRIHQATQAAGRAADSVRLLAVSKTRPAEMISALLAAGQRDFGESYAQEAVDKIRQLQNPDICWHFIGPLQSNKTRLVAEHFHWVHSVDRIKVAQRLSAQRPADMPPLKVLIQVNISAEQSKSGVDAEGLAELAQTIVALPNLSLMGLMAIPVATDDVGQQRAVFRQVRQLRDELAARLGQTLPELSMGMSGDMAAAIAEGATWVRIGTDIFGPRNNR